MLYALNDGTEVKYPKGTIHTVCLTIQALGIQNLRPSG